jgi:hypothetical protein
MIPKKPAPDLIRGVKRLPAIGERSNVGKDHAQT